MAGKVIDASGVEPVFLNHHAKLAVFSSKFLGMSHVGTKLSARLGGWAIRRWQLVSGFISSRKVRGLVTPILVGLFPIAVTLRIIRGNWVSVPFKDEWWHPGGQIVSFFHGTLRFVDLFQQHNESRPLFPRLYNLLMTALTGRWDVKDAMVLMFLLTCVGSFLLLELLRRTTSFDLPVRLWAWALLNFVYFCPREYVNFLWNTILIPLTPGVVLLAAMVVNLSELRLCWKILTNSALAFVATYSFSGGMLLWVLAVPIYLGPRLAGAQNRRANPASWYAVYAFCGVVAVGFYFHHYVRPTRLPPFAVSLADALPLLRFFLSWIGSLFVVPGADPLLFGCFYLAIFAALIVVAIRVARLERNFRRSYPWIVIAASALGWGALVASGRLGRGIGAATASRYAVNVVYFYIGVAGLAASLYDVWVNAGHRMGSRLVFASGLTMGLFTAGWLSSFTTELSRVRVVIEERKDLALAVQWIPAIPLNPDLALGSKAPPKFVADVAISLSRYDALRPRFIPQLLASTVRQNPAHGESLAGTLGSARFSDDHRLLLTGMAWLAYRNAKADCVVVGYTNSDSGLTPFTVFRPTYKRERLKGRFDIKRLPLNGFAASIDPANLPTGTLTLRAWAVDMRAGRALPMTGVITVDNEPVQIN